MTTKTQDTRDEKLLVEVQQGHQRALAELYDRFVGRVYGMALQKLAEPAEAQEVTREVFLMIWQNASTFRPLTGSVAGWLLTIAHNRINSEFRRKRMAGDIQEDISFDPAAEPGPATEGRLEPDLAREALQSLPDEEREVVVLSFYQGNSQAQISRRLGVPLDTVKSRMGSAMARLRNGLNADGVE